MGAKSSSLVRTIRIPNELQNLANLVSLDLYLNKLDGVTPDTLGKLHTYSHTLVFIL